MRIVTLILVIAAVAIAGYPLALQYQSSLKLAQTSRNSAQQVAGWPYPQAEDALAAARAYNAKLARSGQPVLGEAIDRSAPHKAGREPKARTPPPPKTRNTSPCSTRATK